MISPIFLETEVRVVVFLRREGTCVVREDGKETNSVVVIFLPLHLLLGSEVVRVLRELNRRTYSAILPSFAQAYDSDVIFFKCLSSLHFSRTSNRE